MESLVNQMGIVTKILFCSMTVFTIILLGRKMLVMRDVVNAKNSNAYDFIQQMPDKFQTNIGDRSSNLSSRQRQRIAIARAI